MPNITVDPNAQRVNATTVQVTGTYDCQGALGGSISVTLFGNGGSDGGANVASGSGTWTVQVHGSTKDGQSSVHAGINQIIPAATKVYDGTVTVA